MPTHVSGMILVVTIVVVYYAYKCFELIMNKRAPHCGCGHQQPIGRDPGDVFTRAQELNARIANLEVILRDEAGSEGRKER